MDQEKKLKVAMIALAAVIFFLAVGLVAYWFQHQTIQVGRYTVVYYKNQCDMNTDLLPANLEYLKTLPCLIRINWQESLAPDLFQEYSYLPGRGIEETRKIHKSGKGR